MPIRPELLLRDLEGRPLPPPEILAKLHQHDPRLGLFYTKAAWAITEQWPAESPKWAWVQEGSVDASMAFDVCGYLPITCSLDEAPAYIERELRSYTAEQFQALRAAVNHWNDVTLDQQVETDLLGAVSNDLDAGNIVTPGISEPVGIDLAQAPPIDKMAKARAAKAAKKTASIEAAA